MKRDLNVVVFVGNIVRDAELKYLNTGTAVAEFAVAVNDSYKKGESWVEYVSFIDCSMMGKRAEGVHRYLTKGAKVGVQGKMRQDRWETKDGGKRSKLKISVDEIEFLGSRGDSAEAKPAASDFDDDIPF